MKKLSAILLALPLVLCGACSEEEETLPQQRERIVSYLTSTHSPTLVAESAVDTESQQAFYTTSGNPVYRYIDNYYDPARPGRTEVTASSKVTITFRAYVFNFANITDSTFPFYSNDPLLKSAYEEMGLTSGAWSFEPLQIDMRSGNIIKGLRLALLGCRQGDEVEAYMTYNMAYGDTNFSTIERESPLAWFFTVDAVE